jgi:hypothetical protein
LLDKEAELENERK